jgi:hypothetical protein
LTGSSIRIRFSRHEALAVGKVQRLNFSGDKAPLSEKIDQPEALTVSLDIRHIFHQTVFRLHPVQINGRQAHLTL